jgi:phosphatidate phosphatase APP1
MSIGSTLVNWKGAFVRILGVAARPIRDAQGHGGVVLEPYRGYGSQSEVFLIGRVFRQSRHNPEAGHDNLLGHLRDISRRIVRRSVPGAAVTARFYGAEETVATDRDGYFRVHLTLREPPPPGGSWHTMDLALDGAHRAEGQAQIFIPPAGCDYVVISDIDDTVMRTGVASKIKMLWRLFIQDAESRVAFPGVAALYRALHGGPSGNQQNPMLYVSRAPWGIYNVLEEFFDLNGIPVGPILFLREWGISWKSPLPRKAEDHKRELIHNMLDLYDGLPFILIGDSGQHDPEIYRKIVEEHPGRVLAVYIRNVSRSTKRTEEIEALAKVVAQAGSSLLLAADSVAIAEHAAKIGLVSPEIISDVRAERASDGEAGARQKTHRLKRSTPHKTMEAVSQGELKDLLETGPDGAPPSVIVEPEQNEDSPGHQFRR